MQPEVVILILNLSIVLLTYFIIYPLFAGRNLNKLMLNDVLAMLVSLIVSGGLYSGTDYEFNLLIVDTNWFWFAMTTYFVIETPFAQRYIKKNNLFS